MKIIIAIALVVTVGSGAYLLAQAKDDMRVEDCTSCTARHESFLRDR
jgi:hypothetical protein